jgi:DNA-directed RNA polymerase specialized sigma24 family protein
MMMLADYLKQHSPVKPYCSDGLDYGLRIRSRDAALKMLYLQLNPLSFCHALVFDVDREGAAYAAQDAGLPEPSVVIITPHNRYAHLWYLLYAPVATGNAAHQKPLDYLAAIQRTMGRILGADMSYSGLITKNPLRTDAWLSLYSLSAPVRLYTMQQMHEDIGLLDPKRKKPDEVFGFGRNCMLFDKLRKWAYTAIRRHRGSLRRDSRVLWDAECLDKAVSLNAEFLNPLSFAEVRSIAKSTAKFCWRHDPEAESAFLARQSYKGKESGKVRQAQNEDKRVSARLMRIQGLTHQQIADELGVTDRTIRNWLSDNLKSGNEPKSDISPLGDALDGF